MRVPAAGFFALLAILACSDSTDPDGGGGGSPFQPLAGTYELTLTGCTTCDESTPDLALLWKNGVLARIDVSVVSGSGAQGEFLSLMTVSGSNLSPTLNSSEFVISRLTSGEYRGSVGFGDGAISVGLNPNGCSFGMSYPGVDTGAGTCEVR
jgi:hypothetical protein